MIRNPFCTAIENIIKDNVSLMSRYVSAENTIIEDMLQNICNIYFNNDTDMMYCFISKYLQIQGYEKYSYKDKMFEIIKYIISYHIYNYIINYNSHNVILAKLSIDDINKCYELFLTYDNNDYNGHTDVSVKFILNKPEIISILNVYGNYKYILNESGIIVNTDNKESVKDYIVKGEQFNYTDELTRYLEEMPILVSTLTEIINNNINKIIKK
jgi:hypothetical protein